MKTKAVLIFVGLLAAFGVGYAGLLDSGGKSVLLSETLVAADTVAEAWRYDTAVTHWVDIGDASTVQFLIDLNYDDLAAKSAADSIMDYTADTFFVLAQASQDKVTWKTWDIDTLLDTINGPPIYDEFTVSSADSVFGRYLRGMLVHIDSTEADMPDSLGIVRSVTAKFWFITR